MPPGVRSIGAKEQEEAVRDSLTFLLAVFVHDEDPVRVVHKDVVNAGHPAMIVEMGEIGEIEGSGGMFIVTVQKVTGARLGAT